MRKGVQQHLQGARKSAVCCLLDRRSAFVLPQLLSHLKLDRFTPSPVLRPSGPGTRPGLHGQTLVSTGLAGLDSLLGGGLPLGSVLLILEARHPEIVPIPCLPFGPAPSL